MSWYFSVMNIIISGYIMMLKISTSTNLTFSMSKLRALRNLSSTRSSGIWNIQFFIESSVVSIDYSYEVQIISIFSNCRIHDFASWFTGVLYFHPTICSNIVFFPSQLFFLCRAPKDQWGICSRAQLWEIKKIKQLRFQLHWPLFDYTWSISSRVLW